MADQIQSVETAKDYGDKPDDQVRMWLAHIAAYKKEFKEWLERSDKIVKRYRDESTVNTTSPMDQARKFNILWSNVETLKPALYSRTPKVVAQRRNKDRDTISMAAAEILQRATQYMSDLAELDVAMKASRDDYLLTARGQVWIYYEPIYGEEKKGDLTVKQGEDGAYLDQNDKPIEDQSSVKADEDGGYYVPEGGDPYRPVVDEKVCLQHVMWTNFGHTPAPSWNKVTAVWKEELLTREQLIKRFGKEKGEAVQLEKEMGGITKETAEKFGEVFKRAEVYEIWDKTSRKAIWISPGYTKGPLDTIDDPLNLRDFFPCPRPIYGTLTTESLIPVPDYVEYQSQALELDLLSKRIDKLAEACRVNGAYDGSFPQLENILSAGENKLVAVDNWAMFAQQGGIEGAISFVPIEQVATVLKTLVDVRSVAKQDLFEITGLSDLVRGQGAHDATATAERIKNQFVTLRLKDRQAEMERFCRDALRIMAEIIGEHIAPERLLEISGWMESPNARTLNKQAEQRRQEILAAQQAMLAQQMQSQMMGPDGQPVPQPQPPDQMQMQQQQQLPPPQQQSPQDLMPLLDAQMVATQALQLLRDDRMRTFRVDLETDSLVIEDEEFQQKSRTEFLQATSGFLQQAIPAIEKFPKIAPLLGEMLMFGIRGFRVGSQLEDVFEAALNELEGLQPMGQPGDEQKNSELMLKNKQIDIDAKDKQDRLALDSMKFQADDAQRAREHEIKMKELDLQGLALTLQIKKMDLDIHNSSQDIELKRGGLELQKQQATDDVALRRDEMQMQKENATLDREVEQSKIGEQKDARVYARDNQLADMRLEGKMTPDIEEDMKETAAALVQMSNAIVGLMKQMADDANAAQERHMHMMKLMTAPRKLVRDERNQIVGSEIVGEEAP